MGFIKSPRKRHKDFFKKRRKKESSTAQGAQCRNKIHGRWTQSAHGFVLPQLGMCRDHVFSAYNVCPVFTDDPQAAWKHSVYQSVCHIKKLPRRSFANGKPHKMGINSSMSGRKMNIHFFEKLFLGTTWECLKSEFPVCLSSIFREPLNPVA